MLVTVYIPTHNRLPLLRRAIDSVKKQSYNNIELIVVDDGSSDGTRDYLHQCQNEGFLKYISYEKSRGACYARNTAIQCATGYFVTGLDDDDYFSDTRIEEFVELWQYLEQTTEFNPGALFSNYYYIKSGRHGQLIKPSRVTASDLKKANILGSQVFTRLAHLRSIGGFDTEMPAWQDHETWYRLLKAHGSAFNTHRPSYWIDFSHDQDRISYGDPQRMKRAFDLFVAKHHHDFRGGEENALLCNVYNYPQVEMHFKEVVAAAGKNGFFCFLKRYLVRRLADAARAFPSPKRRIIAREE